MTQINDTFRYKSTDIALYIIALANEKKIATNMTKVQKLLYIAYGVFLRVYEERLVNEHPQAWPYGPVFPTTRNRLLKCDDFALISKEDILPKELERMEQDKELNKVIKFVFENFGTWNAGQLSEWSHNEGSPWEQATKTHKFKWGDTISDISICEYFQSLIRITSEN